MGADKMEERPPKLTFTCDRCGRELALSARHAGRRWQCPSCGQIATIPGRTTATTNPERPGSGARSAFHDALLADPPPAEPQPREPAAEEEDAEAALARLRAMQGGRLAGLDEEVPKRKLPWPIDIFLYPLNWAGMTVLLLGAGIPLLLRAITKFFGIFCAVVPVTFIFWVLFIMLHWLGLLLFLMYLNWYVCECIRDSAEGNIRAVDTMATTPGLGELLLQTFRVLACIAVVMAPALIYLLRTRHADETFRVLYAIGGFLLPMALLAVVMFEGIGGLNPFRLIWAIVKTPLQYSGLVAACYVLCLLLPLAVYYLIELWILGYLLIFLAFYQLLILAHLLGRFYWRNEERLYWDA